MKKAFRWSGLGLGCAYLVFVSLFALDAGSFPGLLIHLIPSFLIAGVLYIGFRNTLYGGILAGLLSIYFTLHFNSYTNTSVFMIISGPLIAVSLLLIVSSVLKK